VRASGDATSGLPTIGTLSELAELAAGRPRLYVRWSRGPAADTGDSSADELTGARMPGLSASPLAVEPWWRGPLRLWIARRLYDYSHLEHVKGPGIRPWLLEGDELGRGPDNEPLVRCTRPVAWIADQVIGEAERAMTEHNADWGPLRRPGSARR
jgi:hypothetical protein